MLIDTHLHLNLMIAHTPSNTTLDTQEINAIHTIVAEARVHDVTQLISIGTTVQESSLAVHIAANTPHVYAAIGIHPTEWRESWRKDVRALQTLLRHDQQKKIVAIGECGIDRYRTTVPVAKQRDLFRAQIDLALENSLPIIIHSREAAEETLTCIDEYRGTSLRGVMHCFSYDLTYAVEIISRHFILGIGGTVTYPKNEALRTVVQHTPLEHIVLETDAPFLPPQPWRGQQNHPRYIRYIAEYIAEHIASPYETVARITTQNAHTLFHGLNNTITVQ